MDGPKIILEFNSKMANYNLAPEFVDGPNQKGPKIRALTKAVLNLVLKLVSSIFLPMIHCRMVLKYSRSVLKKFRSVLKGIVRDKILDPS